jgi:hypothetical protein
MDNETMFTAERIAADLTAASMEGLPWYTGDESPECYFEGPGAIFDTNSTRTAIILQANTNLSDYDITADYAVRAANRYPEALEEIQRLRADLDKLKFHLHGIYWEASNAIGDTPKSNRAVGVIATTCHKLIVESYPAREKIRMDHVESKQSWTAHLSLENLTQEQVNALTLQIVEWVEAEGGFMAGGFASEANDEKEPGTDQNQ